MIGQKKREIQSHLYSRRVIEQTHLYGAGVENGDAWICDEVG